MRGEDSYCGALLRRFTFFNRSEPRFYRTPATRLRSCVCAGCGRSFVGSGIPLCAACQNSLPYTHFWKFDCEVALHNLSSVVHLEHIFPLCFYSRGSLVPRLIHSFKYGGQWRLALALGDMLGQYMIESPQAQDLEVIIPVPLHWRKKMIRGYNQSEFIAKGIARQMGLPVWDVLCRHRFTKTQTLVGSHYDRQFNVKDAIRLRRGVILPNELHALLVDDMVTTGATLMACIDALRAVPDLHPSVASIGIARSLITGDRYVDLPISDDEM